MQKEEKLLKCFTNAKKRRVLNILTSFEMTPEGLHEVTGIPYQSILNYLSDFVKVGLIEMEEAGKHTIYRVWYVKQEISTADVPPARIIAMRNIGDSYNRELRRKGRPEQKLVISRQKLVRRRLSTNTLPGFPQNFIKEVFSLFQFDKDSRFRRDIDKARAINQHKN